MPADHGQRSHRITHRQHVVTGAGPEQPLCPRAHGRSAKAGRRSFGHFGSVPRRDSANTANTTASSVTSCDVPGTHLFVVTPNDANRRIVGYIEQLNRANMLG